MVSDSIRDCRSAVVHSLRVWGIVWGMHGQLHTSRHILAQAGTRRELLLRQPLTPEMRDRQ